MHRYVITDVFTDAPLEGNSLGVFLDASDLDSQLMQRTARELNLSETTFVLPPESAEADAHIRIFTPGTELPFAGHPVLGTAVVLGSERPELSVIRLQTGRGVVPIELMRDADGRITYADMSQPLPEIAAYERADELLAALGVMRAELPIESYINGPEHIYVVLADAPAVAGLSPDLRALAALGPIGVNVCAVVGDHVKTRNFSPGLGVSEDPATGSAAGPLIVHLARHGRVPYGETIEIRQGEEIGRPARLFARVDGSPDDIASVHVGGSAVIVARGEFRLR
jgi:trans-2,3-dihydro-3-hydroxyanthranilate isomerase